jgi:hypothetical protein
VSAGTSFTPDRHVREATMQTAAQRLALDEYFSAMVDLLENGSGTAFPGRLRQTYRH